MATPGFKARILNGEFSLSAKLSDISLPMTVEMLDSTTFADTAKRSTPGLDHSTLSCEGFIDADTNTDVAAWTSTQPFSYAPTGLALGAPAIIVNTLKSAYEPGTQVGGLASFSLSGETDGPTGFGVSLHDLTAETIDASGTGVDNLAATANGGAAHLHVTAFSGLSAATIIVEDSANNSAWATIGTFAAVSGVTSERITFAAAAVRRYLRYSVDVTGTGSITFAVLAARH